MAAPVFTAAAKVFGKAMATRAASAGAKKSGGGSLGVVAAVITVFLVVLSAPFGLMIFAVMAIAGGGALGDSGPPGWPGGPDDDDDGIVTLTPAFPTCATIREVGQVDPATANATWSPEQLRIARTIMTVGQRLDVTPFLLQDGSFGWEPPGKGEEWPERRDVSTVPARAVTIAMMTAMQESSLQNLNHDDDAENPDGSIADGGGVFQQQPSQGWGTWEQVTDPRYATSHFLVRLLTIVPDWEELPPWEVAHQVQGNLDAQDYRKWWEDGDAIELVDRFLDTSKCAVLPLEGNYQMTSGFGPRNLDIAGASTWHPAWDFATGTCGAPIHAIRPGTVTMLGGGSANNLGITDPETGAELQYLHTPPGSELVAEGDTVRKGQQIAEIGGYGVGGCHLDLRVYAPRVDGEERPTDSLTHTEDLTEETYAGYVHPNHYTRELFGLNLCRSDVCEPLDETGIKN